MNNNNKQKGIGLIELTLVALIGVTLYLMGMRLYQGMKLTTNLQKATSEAHLLLSATGKYYLSICMTDPSTAGNQYNDAKEAMDAANEEGIDIAENLYQYLPSDANTYISPYGKFIDGDNYKASFKTQAPAPTPSPTTDMDFQGQAFDSDYVWVIQVQICDSRYDSDQLSADPGLLASVKGSYHANSATIDSSICDGAVVSWFNFPRNVALKTSGSYSPAAQGSNGRFNKMYQWSHEMKSAYPDDRLNYMCQN